MLCLSAALDIDYEGPPLRKISFLEGVLDREIDCAQIIIIDDDDFESTEAIPVMIQAPFITLDNTFFGLRHYTFVVINDTGGRYFISLQLPDAV